MRIRDLRLVVPILSVCLLAAPALSAESRPNILMVVTDDQGYWDLRSHGNKQIDTPHLDRLAAESVRFDRFYVQPVCAPTRAGLMTGRYYLRTGVYNTRFGGDSMSLSEITVAQLLKRAGYRTGLFGKWHLGQYAGYRPHERGFDEFLGHYHGHIEHYDYPTQLVHNGKKVHARGYVTDLFTDAALDFIDDSRQPFFCYVAYNAPHSPFVAGASHDGQPAADKLIEKYLQRGVPLRDSRIYAMCEIIDRNVGRLLKKLDASKISRETVVVFLTDNGGVSKHFKAGLKGNKASVYEGGVRSPLFVRWPRQFAPRRVQLMASHVDLMPTFCELAGAPMLTDRVIDGKSLLPILRGTSSNAAHKYVYHTWHRYHPNSRSRWAISGERYKLGANGGTGNDNPPMFLYDLKADPGETRNILKQQPEVAKHLRGEFLRWFDDVTKGREYRAIRIPVGHPGDAETELQASWANLKGESITYTFRGYDWDTIDSWTTVGESATWRLDVKQAGEYAVVVHTGGRTESGTVLRITCGKSKLDFSPISSVTGSVFVPRKIGSLQLPAGSCDLIAAVIKADGENEARLNRIFIQPMR